VGSRFDPYTAHQNSQLINKIDRADAVIDDVVNRTFDLFVHLGTTDEQLDFPIVYTAAPSTSR
jgi:GTP-binding protein